MKPYLRVTLAYALFGILWVFLSDRVVGFFTSDARELAYLQMMKGWLFVALSTLLIFTMARRAFEKHCRTEQEKLAVFHKTVEGSYHILLNYLNQMQLVTLEAEQCEQFDRAILGLATEASGEATASVLKLREIQTITADHIDAVVYEKTRRRSGPV